MHVMVGDVAMDMLQLWFCHGFKPHFVVLRRIYGDVVYNCVDWVAAVYDGANWIAAIIILKSHVLQRYGKSKGVRSERDNTKMPDFQTQRQINDIGIYRRIYSTNKGRMRRISRIIPS